MATFPLTLNINQGSIPYKMTVQDSEGTTFMQAVQLRNLKRQIEVTTYQNHQQQIYQLTQEKLLSMRPVYDIWNQQGRTIGTIALQSAMRGDQYNVFDGKNCVFQTQIEPGPHDPHGVRNLLIILTVAIVLLSLTYFYAPTMLPLLCALCGVLSGMGTFAGRSGYFGTSTYSVKRPDGRRVIQFSQVPGFTWNRLQFSIRLLDRISPTEEHAALCAITLMLLERSSSAD
jgi:hypothetical protein